MRKRLTDLGSQTAVGGTAGLVTGGPVGAAVGAGAPIAVWALREFANRVLSREEESRVATALEVGAERIAERLEAGDRPRADGFFEAGEGRTDAKRLIEGILVTAQRDFDDRKAAHYGYMLANVGFETKVDPITAQRLISLGSELSYTHLQVLALVGRKDRMALPETGSKDYSGLDWRELSILAAFDDLDFGRLDLIGQAQRKDVSKLKAPFGPPSNLEVKNFGLALHVLMELDRIPDEELEPLASVLWKVARQSPEPAR